MISARNLSYGYPSRGRSSRDRPAVTGVSLDVAAGARLGILGPNGSGKTTLLKLLGGVLAPSSGEIALDGVPLRQLGRQRVATRIAMVPQDTHPAFDYTAIELVLMGRYPHLGAFEVEGQKDLDLARDALAATGTLAFMDRYFSTLSGGERQRVVIASALAQQPELLLLDEPTASLDPGFQIEIADLLDRLHRERGIALVLSTHDLNFAASLCDTLILMREGTVVAAGATRDVLTADRISAIYGIAADVAFHQRAGHMVVVPVGRTAR